MNDGLTLTGVRKTFASRAGVHDATLSVPRGALLGLLGPNGAGKTTTIRMIVGILEPDGGTITWKGEPVAAVSRARLGYLPEERGLFPRMAVGEQVEFFARIRGVGAAQARRQTARWIERVGLEDHAEQPTQELSKGNQQKVQLLCALVHQPELVVLDEPFSGLDPINYETFEGAVRELHELGTTVVLSTHEMERAEQLCEEVALVHDGRVTFSGDLNALRERHGDDRHPVGLRDLFLKEVRA